MSYYESYGKQKTRGQKRRHAETRGGFGDEGSRYSSRTPRAGGDEGGRGKTRSSSSSAGNARPSPARDSGGHQAGEPAGRRPYAPQDRRPYGERERRRYGAPAGIANPALMGYSGQRKQGEPAGSPPYTRRDGQPRGDKAEGYHYAQPVVKNPPVPVEKPAAYPAENLLSGRNPIREALKSGRDIEKLLVARGELSGSAREIVRMARDRHIPVQEVDRARLDAITSHHQGMLAFASAYQYSTVENMLSLAAERGESPFLVVLDGVTDPHNLGAIIRTAECAGAHGVIVQERRAAGLTPSAVKASAGAVEYLPVARVINLTAVLCELKEQGIWIYAADGDGEDYHQVDLSGALALVIGAEGEGIGRRVLDNCDRRLALPVRGHIGSLNASVAAGILMYAVMRAR